jgi:hypothetical protein
MNRRGGRHQSHTQRDDRGLFRALQQRTRELHLEPGRRQGHISGFLAETKAQSDILHQLQNKIFGLA